VALGRSHPRLFLTLPRIASKTNGPQFILPVAPPDQGTRRTMVLHTLLGCPSSLTYREMPKARCGRWCTLT